MMAITILAIVAVTLYGTFSRTLRSKGIAEERAEITRTGRSAVSRMAEEIGAAFCPEQGVDGTIFRSLSGGTESAPLDALLFSAFSARPAGAAGRDSDQRVISYFFAQRSGLVRGVAERRPDDDAADFFEAFGPRRLRVSGLEPERLLRREAVTIRREALETSSATAFLDNVASLDLRFHDGTEWLEAWDSEDRGTYRRRLPKAVAIDLALYDLDGEIHHFTTAVDLALADLRSAPARSPGTRASPRPRRSP
jgi:hypothetical protein